MERGRRRNAAMRTRGGERRDTNYRTIELLFRLWADIPWQLRTTEHKRTCKKICSLPFGCRHLLNGRKKIKSRLSVVYWWESTSPTRSSDKSGKSERQVWWWFNSLCVLPHCALLTINLLLLYYIQRLPKQYSMWYEHSRCVLTLEMLPPRLPNCYGGD